VRTFLHLAIVVLALGLAGAAAGAGTKPTLTVAVSGNGTVSSRPAGINCRPTCKMHAKEGAKITLTADPNAGTVFSHWGAPCGTRVTCTVTMTGSRVVHAFFTVEPAPPPPPPPPPPPAKAGNYAGTYTDGTFFKVFVDSPGAHAFNVSFDFNGDCSNGGTSWDTGYFMNGPFAIQSDGTFSATATTVFSNSTVSATVNGKFTSSGLASGTLTVSLEFINGPDCTSSGTWSAQDQD
jgi:hypothetical protein